MWLPRTWSGGGEVRIVRTIVRAGPVSQSQELRQVEDDGEEEEDEGVGQPGLGAEAELEAVDC